MESNPNNEENREPEKKNRTRTLVNRVFYILAAVIALVPLFAYLILLPMLPDSLPVKYDSMGLPSINVAKTSLHMILFSLEGVIGFLVMLLVGRVAQSFARKTYRSQDGMGSTQTTLAVMTLVISGLLAFSWFLTVIPMLS